MKKDGEGFRDGREGEVLQGEQVRYAQPGRTEGKTNVVACDREDGSEIWAEAARLKGAGTLLSRPGKGALEEPIHKELGIITSKAPKGLPIKEEINDGVGLASTYVGAQDVPAWQWKLVTGAVSLCHRVVAG